MLGSSGTNPYVLKFSVNDNYILLHTNHNHDVRYCFMGEAMTFPALCDTINTYLCSLMK